MIRALDPILGVERGVTSGVERGITSGMASAMELLRSNFMLTPRTVQPGTGRNLQISVQNTQQSAGAHRSSTAQVVSNEFRPRQPAQPHSHRDDDDWSEVEEMPPLASHPPSSGASRKTVLDKMKASAALDKKYALPKTPGELAASSQAAENVSREPVGTESQLGMTTVDEELASKDDQMLEQPSSESPVETTLVNEEASIDEEKPMDDQVPVENIIAQLEAETAMKLIAATKAATMVDSPLETSTISVSSGGEDDDGRFPDDPNDDFTALYAAGQNPLPDDDEDRLVIDEEHQSPPKTSAKKDPRSPKRGKL